MVIRHNGDCVHTRLAQGVCVLNKPVINGLNIRAVITDKRQSTGRSRSSDLPAYGSDHLHQQV